MNRRSVRDETGACPALEDGPVQAGFFGIGNGVMQPSIGNIA